MELIHQYFAQVLFHNLLKKTTSCKYFKKKGNLNNRFLNYQYKHGE